MKYKEIKVGVSEELKAEIQEYAEGVNRTMSNLMLHAIKVYMKMHPQ